MVTDAFQIESPMTMEAAAGRHEENYQESKSVHSGREIGVHASPRTNAEDIDVICTAFEKSYAIFLGRSWHPERFLSPSERARLVDGMRLMRSWSDLTKAEDCEQRRENFEKNLSLPRWLLVWEVSQWFFLACKKEDEVRVWNAARPSRPGHYFQQQQNAEEPMSMEEWSELCRRFRVRLDRDKTSPPAGLAIPDNAPRGTFALFDCFQDYVDMTCEMACE